MNGPLPVEWENEVFEKFEPPYRREGSRFVTGSNYHWIKTPLLKDSLIQLIKKVKRQSKHLKPIQ